MPPARSSWALALRRMSRTVVPACRPRCTTRPTSSAGPTCSSAVASSSWAVARAPPRSSGTSSAADDGREREILWLTRSPRFFPLEYTKLTLEMTSPEYVDHIHALPPERRESLIASQAQLYKGISGDLVDDIYDALYAAGVDGPPNARLFTNTAVTGSIQEPDGTYRLTVKHADTGEERDIETDGLVLATGYKHEVPAFLAPVADRIRWDERGRFDVTRDYRVDVDGPPIWVQNAELHTHGFAAPDLGMAAYRNSFIVRGITGREVYPIETRIAHQEFGLPEVAPLRQEVSV